MSPDAANAASTIAVVTTFAAFVTVHIAILFGLGVRHEGRRLLGSLVVPLLAPYFAVTLGMGARATLWIATGVAYAIAFAVAS